MLFVYFFFLLLNLTFYTIFNKFIYFILFTFGCVGSSLLCGGFLQLRQAGATLPVVCGLLIAVASLVAVCSLHTFLNG